MLRLGVQHQDVKIDVLAHRVCRERHIETHGNEWRVLLPPYTYYLIVMGVRGRISEIFGNNIYYMDIKELLGIEYLNKFKVVHYDTLFPPDWKMLQVGCCPLCFNKLKHTRDGNIIMCIGKKHGKAFIITRKKYQEIIEKTAREGQSQMA